LDKTRSDTEARQDWLKIVKAIRDAAGEETTDEAALQLERRIGQARERWFFEHGGNSSRQFPAVVSVQDFSKRLPADTMVVEYVAGPNHVWRFDITAAGFNVVEVGQTKLVASAIDATLYEFNQFKDARSLNRAHLSSTLLHDFDLPAGVSRLLVSPDGTMNSVPYATLEYQAAYLAERVSITYVPSISEYAADNAPPERTQSRLSIAVLADPAFGHPEVKGPSTTSTQVERFRNWSDTLEPLPATALEAQSLQKLYGAEDSVIFTGDRATRTNLFDASVRNARIVHIATHGYFNEQLPELIGIALTPDSTSDDGFVTMAEISTQQFNAELVVISACSTARGATVPGEGNMSLARTFLAQGVNSVVSTLWPVSDNATALFMKEFYRALKEDGSTYTEALRRAQLGLRESDRFDAPFYWGAYTLTSVSPQVLH
ncbi:MAG: CHAT domain-containing protein, partial [Anaerolineae bacterium]|nr:CHAT domain-containing protein [Anaerolineae bacterium]